MAAFSSSMSFSPRIFFLAAAVEFVAADDTPVAPVLLDHIPDTPLDGLRPRVASLTLSETVSLGAKLLRGVRDLACAKEYHVETD